MAFLYHQGLEKISKGYLLGHRSVEYESLPFQQAKEIIEMASNYLSDAEYFEQKGDLINAFAALNYAHGWLDSGVRLGIFNVKDDKLFTIK